MRKRFLVFLVLALGVMLSGYSCEREASKTLAAGTKGASAAGVNFYYSNDATYLVGTLETNSTGWVAVGFGGSTMAETGRVVMGMVTGVTHEVEVHSIEGRSHTMVDVTLEASGSDIGGVTTITFKIALADLGMSGLSGKTIPIILARNAYTKNFKIYHSGQRGSSVITLN